MFKMSVILNRSVSSEQPQKTVKLWAIVIIPWRLERLVDLLVWLRTKMVYLPCHPSRY